MKPNEQALRSLLAQQGTLSSAVIQQALGISQPSASRLLAALGDEIVTVGAARSRRYALGAAIHSLSPHQPLWRVDEGAQVQRLGQLNFLARAQIHLQGEGVDLVFDSSAEQPVPWLLSGWRPQGFLGRLLARQIAPPGAPTSVELWRTQDILYAATQTPDTPGALLLGSPPSIAPAAALQIDPVDPGADLDRLALDAARALPVGSSAGGEQPKFLAFDATGASFLVKFSPPRGTPFGERWHDLLVAESLCAEVLGAFGYPAARARLVQTGARTYLLSERFDRTAAGGRRQVVSVGAAHAGLCRGAYVHWAATCEALVGQGRLAAPDARRAHDLLNFGRLTGNTDMHAGNAAFFVQGETLQEMLAGALALAPVYDMLPMRWKPDPMLGNYAYEAFVPDRSMASAQVCAAARAFWQQLARHPSVSAPLQSVAAAMALQM